MVRGIIARIGRLIKIRAVEDLCVAYQVLAMAHFAAGDRISCIRAMESAHAQGHLNVNGFANFLVYYGNWGDAEKCLELCKLINENFKDSKTALRAAVSFASMFCARQLTNELFEALSNISINDPIDETHGLIKRMFSRTEARMEELKFREEDVRARLETAVNFLRENYIEVQRINAVTLHDGSFMYQLFIQQGTQECSELNFGIAENLCVNFEDTGIELFSVVCRPLNTYQEVMSG